METIVALILLFLPHAGETISKNGGISSRYYPENEISASEFLINLQKSPLRKKTYLCVEEFLLGDSAFKNFKINTLTDTIYFKTESYRYNDIQIVHPIAIWDNKQFVYKTDLYDDPRFIVNWAKGPLHTVKNYRKYCTPFFRLVEKWDTTAIRAAEYRLGHTEPTVVNRVIFKNHTFTLDSFKFYRLHFDELGDKAIYVDFNILSHVISEYRKEISGHK